MRLKKTVMILGAVVLASLAQGSTGKLFLCFDDRNFNGWESSIPLFTKYKAHATFFISGPIDDRAITCMRRLKDAGHSLGLHGLKHRRAPEALRELGPERYLSEEVLPQIAAARNAGFNIRNWAYPYSTRTAATDTALMRHF